MTLRLEEEVGRYRADTGFTLFVDTLTEQNTLQLLRDAAQGWQKSFEEGTVKSSLRIVLFTGLMNKLLETLRLVQTDDALRARLMTVGWLSEGSNALVPTWHYYRWDPETRQQVKDDREMHQVETLMRVGTSPTTLLRFKTLHKLGVETPQAEVVPFKISVSLRGPEAQSMFEALTALSYNGALKLLGLRLRPERMQKTALATELENAYLNTSFTDWTRRNPQWGRSSKKGSSDQ